MSLVNCTRGEGGRAGVIPSILTRDAPGDTQIFFEYPRVRRGGNLWGTQFFFEYPIVVFRVGFWVLKFSLSIHFFLEYAPLPLKFFLEYAPLPLKPFLSTPLCPLPQPSPSARMMWNRRCLFKFLCLKITWATLSREPTWEAQVRAPTEFSLGPDISSSERNMYVKW